MDLQKLDYLKDVSGERICRSLLEEKGNIAIYDKQNSVGVRFAKNPGEDGCTISTYFELGLELLKYMQENNKDSNKQQFYRRALVGLHDVLDNLERLDN